MRGAQEGVGRLGGLTGLWTSWLVGFGHNRFVVKAGLVLRGLALSCIATTFLCWDWIPILANRGSDLMRLSRRMRSVPLRGGRTVL